MDEQRDQLIRSTRSPLAAQMAPLDLSMYVSQMPASVVEGMEKNRADALARMSADLAPALVEAMRSRAIELRKQDLTLTAARLGATGMAH